MRAVFHRTGEERPGRGTAGGVLLATSRFLTRAAVSDDLRAAFHQGGREGDAFYRDRWSHDKVVPSTHGVNCTGSCRWNVYLLAERP
ncbi:hypothetical protein AB0G02_38465, partial [Actinosynnema sp. NPDC023658]|uniref:hypothetical protein n=1 Tax=Actinosynnema sp. NPDC023658 TaxID=3155465 RepID=UPI0033EF2C8E